MTSSSAVHDDKYYLADGDLAICSAPSPAGSATVFRVHKAVMAYHSPVFRGMLGLPPAPGTQEMYDDAPVVQVTDSAEELRALLDALYDPGALRVPRWDPNAPLTLTPAMRLARKYEIDAVCKRIVDTIKESWPQTYEDWLRFRAEYAMLVTMCDPKNKEFSDPTPLWARVPEPGAALRFAREFDVPEILLSAYYTLATISAKDEWEDFTRDWSVPNARFARWGLVAPEDLVCVLRARETFGKRMELIKHQWLDPQNLQTVLVAERSARSPCACPGNVSELLSLLKQSTVTPDPHCPDPLGALESMYNTSEGWPLCHGCTRALKLRLQKEQRRIWDILYVDFGLAG